MTHQAQNRAQSDLCADAQPLARFQRLWERLTFKKTAQQAVSSQLAERERESKKSDFYSVEHLFSKQSSRHFHRSFNRAYKRPSGLDCWTVHHPLQGRGWGGSLDPCLRFYYSLSSVFNSDQAAHDLVVCGPQKCYGLGKVI